MTTDQTRRSPEQSGPQGGSRSALGERAHCTTASPVAVILSRHQRQQRRMTWGESERQLLDCLEHLGLLAKASRISATPINRGELKRQCEGLRQLLADTAL